MNIVFQRLAMLTGASAVLCSVAPVTAKPGQGAIGASWLPKETEVKDSGTVSTADTPTFVASLTRMEGMEAPGTSSDQSFSLVEALAANSMNGRDMSESGGSSAGFSFELDAGKQASPISWSATEPSVFATQPLTLANPDKTKSATTAKNAVDQNIVATAQEAVFEEEQVMMVPEIPHQMMVTDERDQLLAQTSLPPTSEDSSPAPDVLVPNPEIIIEGGPTAGPGDVQPQTAAPPFLPRAVAPPVGDIAVSNINTTPNVLDLGTPILVPRLVLREAPIREVLTVLARQAGLNLIFTDEGEGDGLSTISLDLQNEPIQDVFNSVLLISGLNANRRGQTIFVGSQLPDAARNLVSRTFRLNQVKSENAAVFLASQGAEGQRLVTPQTDIVDPETQRVIRTEFGAAELQGFSAQREGSRGAFLLEGLQVSTDDRLNTLTMVGEPRQVEMATAFLVQLDARRRQVAVNVKVVDINLANTDTFNSSFSFGFQDGFFVQDNGTAILNFGSNRPADAAAITSIPGGFLPPVTAIPLPGGVTTQPFFDIPGVTRAPFDTSIGVRPNFGTVANPLAPGVVDISEEGVLTFEVPELFQFPQRFLLELDAQIVSGNAKVLTDPTLVVQEGQSASVKLVEQVVISFDSEVDPLSGVRTTTPVIGEAGLTLTIDVERIDDNGFIALSVNPKVSAPGETQIIDSGLGGTNEITLLIERELESGAIRLRDGQTLILSGIISETDTTSVSKVPILGDIPLLGALFRSSQRTVDRSEVVVVVTPQIIGDSAGSSFGYNYTPGKEARELLRRQGLPVPGAP